MHLFNVTFFAVKILKFRVTNLALRS